jgi:hypothetical protein
MCITNWGRDIAPGGYTFVLSPTGEFALLIINTVYVKKKGVCAAKFL